MSDSGTAGRSREAAIAQAFAVLFIGAYFVVPHLAPPLFRYRWSLMLLGLACFIPSLITADGRNPRRTDRVLALMFACSLIPSLLSMVRFLDTPFTGMYTSWTLAFVVGRGWFLILLLAVVVLCLFIRHHALKWVLVVYIVLEAVLMRVAAEPNNPGILELRAQGVAQAQAKALAARGRVVHQASAAVKTVRTVFPVWNYAFYAVALVYAFLLRRPPEAPTPEAEESEQHPDSQAPRAP